MAEYINRDALLEEMQKHRPVFSSGLDGTRERLAFLTWHSCLNAIKTFPAADVRPVAWIPVTERLPEKPGSYLVYVYGDVTEMNFWHGKWHILGDDHTKSVTHWMPLPEPPKDGDA